MSLSQCTYRCVVLPDASTITDLKVGMKMSQCTYRCVVLPDPVAPVAPVSSPECLNAPTGAWCSLTDPGTGHSADPGTSQCTYRCVVLPDCGLRLPSHSFTGRLNAPTGAWCSLTFSRSSSMLLSG